MPRPRTGFTYDLSLQARSLRRRVKPGSGAALREGSTRSSNPPNQGAASRRSRFDVASEARRWIALGPSATAELTGNRVSVSGELDLTESHSLRSYIEGLREGPEVIDCTGVSFVIDCTGVSFVGAAGLTALLAATRVVSPPMIVASPALVRMARLCGVDGVLGIPAPH